MTPSWPITDWWHLLWVTIRCPRGKILASSVSILYIIIVYRVNLNKLSPNFVGALRTTPTNCRVSFIDLYSVFPRNCRILFLPYTNTVMLLEPYCDTIKEHGLPTFIPGERRKNGALLSHICLNGLDFLLFSFSPCSCEIRLLQCLRFGFTDETFNSLTGHVSKEENAITAKQTSNI